MAEQKSVSAFLKQHNTRLAEIHKAAQGKKVEFGQKELPGGIEGIAQLKEIKVGAYGNDVQDEKLKGKPYLYVSATVKEPKEYASYTTKLALEPLCDTSHKEGKRKTSKEHLDYMNGLLCMLLGKESVDWDLDELDDYLALLNKTKPHIAFRTWKPPIQTEGKYAGKESRVLHFWDARVEYNKPINQAALVEETSSNGVHEESSESFDDGASSAENEFSYATATLDNLDQVVKGVEDSDDGALERLYELAIEVGVSRQQIDDADSWDDAKTLIVKASEMPEEKPKEKLTLKVGHVYKYHPYDKKAKGPAKKAVQCELKALNKTKDKATLVNMVDKSEYKDVPVSELTL